MLLTDHIKFCDLCGGHIMKHYDAPSINSDPRANVKYMQCVNCDLIMQSPRMGEEEAREYYTGEKYREGMQAHSEPSEANFKEQLLRAIDVARYISNDLDYDIWEHERLLDVGGSLGILATHLQAANPNIRQVHIVEPNMKFARFAMGLGLVAFDTLGEINTREYYDLITIVHTLEHLHEPHKVLKRLLELAVPGGLLYIQVPSLYHHAARWINHLTVFTYETLAEMVELSGWIIDRKGLTGYDTLEMMAYKE